MSFAHPGVKIRNDVQKFNLSAKTPKILIMFTFLSAEEINLGHKTSGNEFCVLFATFCELL